MEKIKSVHKLTELVDSGKIDLSEQIAIRRLHYVLKEEDKTYTDLNRYMQFSEYLWKFERMAENAALNCKKYWTELIQQSC